MLNSFIPDIYQKSIYDINYKKLKKIGIKCLIFDLNNTIAPINIKKPTKKMRELFEELKNMKFKILIISNSPKKRVEPFKDLLGIDSSYLSFKPLKRKYLKAMEIYHFKTSQIACIGEGLLTDIWGANRMEFLSILVNPIAKSDYAISKMSRFIEPAIYKRLEKKELLKKGAYYE